MSTHTASRKILRMTGLTVAILFVVALLAFSTIYLLRQSLATMMGTMVLSPFGIELRSISGLQIGVNAITVESVRFVIVEPNSNPLLQESTLENARVTFEPGPLLQGRIEDIEISSLTLFGIPATNSETAPSERPGSTLQLEAATAALQQLPLSSISVGSFSFPPYLSNASVTMSRNQREVSSQIATSDFNLDLRINWHDTAFVSSHFIPDPELPDHVFPGDALTGAMRLHFREELAASADFTLAETGNLLAADGNGDVHLTPLMQFLQHHDLLADELTGVEGTIHFSALAQEQSSSQAEQQLNFVVSMLENSHASGTVPSYPGDSSARFVWSADQPLEVSGSYEPQAGTVSLTAEDQNISMSLLSQGEERQLTLNLADLSAQCIQGAGCIATQSSILHVPFAASGNAMLENLNAVTSAELSISDSALAIRLATGSRIAADSITYDAITLEDVNLLVLETLDLDRTATGELRASSNGAELYLPSIVFGDSHSSAVLKATDLLLVWPGTADAQPQIRARMQIRNPGSDMLPVIFRKPEIDATLALADGSLQVNSQLRLADRNILEINATHSLASGTGEGAFAIPPLQFASGQQSLSQLFFSMPYEADVVSGTLAANAQLRWHLDDTGQFLASGPLSVNVDQLTGFYGDVALLGLSTHLVGELEDLQFTSTDSLHMQIASIDPGLPIENIALDYFIDTANTTLEIRDVQASMFNGRLSSTGLAYDWGAPENLFALAFENIDLSRVLAMGAYEGINATGLVSGALPVRLAGSNVSVRGGTLQVQAPGGSIRYQSSTAGNTGNAALDLVNLALSNYQYDVLDAEVDYLPSGELLLAVKLEGISPAVNEGQQINVNLNVTDNIPALLESLQASRNITDALQRQLDER